MVVVVIKLWFGVFINDKQHVFFFTICHLGVCIKKLVSDGWVHVVEIVDVALSVDTVLMFMFSDSKATICYMFTFTQAHACIDTLYTE